MRTKRMAACRRPAETPPRCALRDAWQRTVRRLRGERALVEAATGRSCTFGELDQQATAWLATQAGAGTELRGHVVAFAAPNGIEWMTMFVALVRAGAVVLPLDAVEPAGSQRRTAETVGASAWWDGARLVPLAPAAVLRHRALRLIKLTSGTTGEPRALAFNSEQLLADARQVTTTMGIRRRDLNYALIPFGHSYGLGNLTLPLIARGVPVVCGSVPLPHVIAAEIARWRPTVLPSVPAVFRGLLSAELGPDALAPVRLVISAGAPLAPEVARDFAARYQRRIHNFYGSSETGGIAYDHTGAATLAGGVGTAMRGVKIAPRRGGRIEICSPAVFTHRNGRRVGACGCWVPPDLVRMNRRGQLALLGRLDRTVKLGGRRLNLAEVAARLRRLAGVRDAWVGVQPGTEPLLGAAVVTERTVVELRAELLADTAAWKVPKKIAVLREFPLTGRGKMDTRAIERAVFG